MSSPTPGFVPLRELGRGATSVVRLARLREPLGDRPTGALVAVKRLLPACLDDERARRAMLDEAAAAAEAHHPSLVRVLFSGEDEEGPFLASEYVPGPDLRSELERRRRLPEAEVRAVGTDLAEALAALHRARRVHGDLKPENVRLDAAGRAVLLDLGFARRSGDRGPDTPGTLAYSPPEALRGEPTTPKSDVFSLAVLLYELATGEHPFLTGLGEPGSADLDHHIAELLAGKLDPPSRHVPDLSPFLDRLLGESLAPTGSARPAAAELARALARGEESAFWHERIELAARDALPPVPSVARLPLVGRREELHGLRDAFGLLASEGEPGGPSGCAVWMEGPTGSGKSRLLHEFATLVRTSARPPLFLYARASERREARPLGTLLFLLRRWLALPAGKAAGEREFEILRRTLPPREADTLAAALAGTGATLPPYLPSAVAEWLAALAKERPLLVCVDDLHAANESTLSTLGLFARELPSREALLALGVRSDEPVARPDDLRLLRGRLRDLAARARPVPLFELELGPVDEAAVLETVNARFLPREPRLRLARILHERCLGNPGLLVEILNGLVTAGSVHPASRTDTRWTLAIAPNDVPVPVSLERAIEERYARLDPDGRTWLARLAVLGGSFDAEFVQAIFAGAPGGAPDPAPHLARFVEGGWLARIGGRLRFRRPALREAVYAALPADERSRLHAHISDRLEAVTGERGWDSVFQRAFHLSQAGRHRELIDLVEPFLPDMAGIGQPERTYRLARWGVEACERAGDVEPERVLDFLELAADAANRLGRRRSEREMLDRMIALPLDLQREPAAAARVYLAHGRFALGRGEVGLARGWLRNAGELARAAGSDALLGDTLRRLALAHALTGELDQARAAADEALEVAPDARRRALASIARARVLVLTDDIDSTLASLDRADDELGADPGSLGARAAIDMLRARAFRSTGRQARALGSASRAVRRARQAGVRGLEVEASARLGGLLIDLDRLDDAEAHLRDALHLAREIEDRAGAVLAQVFLAILQWERADPSAAAAIEEAVLLAEEMGHRRVVAIALALRARVALAAGDTEGALAASGRAKDLLDRLGAELTDRIVIAGTRVRALREAGKTGEARADLRQLRGAVRSGPRTIAEPELRRAQRSYADRLLEAALTAEGPLYPRTSEEGGETSPPRELPR